MIHDSLVFLKVSCVTSGLLMKKSFGKMLKMVSSKKPRTMVAQRRRWNVGGRFLELHLHHVSLLHWRVNFGIRFGVKPSPFMDSHTLAFVSLCFLYLFSTFKSSLTLILDRRWLRPLGLTWIRVLRVTLFAAGSLRWPGRPTSADVDRALGRADPQARKMRMCSNETDQIRVKKELKQYWSIVSYLEVWKHINVDKYGWSLLNNLNLYVL